MIFICMTIFYSQGWILCCAEQPGIVQRRQFRRDRIWCLGCWLIKCSISTKALTYHQRKPSSQKNTNPFLRKGANNDENINFSVFLHFHPFQRFCSDQAIRCDADMLHQAHNMISQWWSVTIPHSTHPYWVCQVWSIFWTFDVDLVNTNKETN